MTSVGEGRKNNIIIFAREYFIEGWKRVFVHIDKTVLITPIILNANRSIDPKIKNVFKGEIDTCYFIHEGYDSSGRRDIGKQLSSIVASLKPLVPVITKFTILSPRITKYEKKYCQQVLDNDGFNEVKIIDPCDDELFKQYMSIEYGCLY